MNSATGLQKILVDSPVGVVLPAICASQQRFAIALLNLPNWWLAGGAVRNTVWRSLFGNECQLVINDTEVDPRLRSQNRLHQTIVCQATLMSRS
jgi:hypothetical protein